MKLSVQGRVKTRIVSAVDIEAVKDGKYIILKERPWESNLVLDQGLNALARSTANALQCNSGVMGTDIQVGSGTNPVKVASGAVTFTQAGTTVTASGSFFTAAMVGAIFKYGTGSGGAEQYIVSQTGTACVVAGAGMTVAVPDIATVWMVQQTALQTAAFTSRTYQTVAGDCSTTLAGNILTQKRTIIVPSQVAPYNVNEIGYSSNNSMTRCLGRIVLSSTDVVAPTNFYVVILELAFTVTPGSPTAVGNVGTNIDTSGNAMVEGFSNFAWPNINGATGNLVAGNHVLEGGGIDPSFFFITEAYTQNSAPNLATNFTVTNIVNLTPAAAWTFDGGGAVGRMTFSKNTTVSTAGESARGMCIGNVLAGNRPCFDIKFTTPVTLPTGTFQPNTVWQSVYSRTLVN